MNEVVRELVTVPAISFAVSVIQGDHPFVLMCFFYVLQPQYDRGRAHCLLEFCWQFGTWAIFVEIVLPDFKKEHKM